MLLGSYEDYELKSYKKLSALYLDNRFTSYLSGAFYVD